MADGLDGTELISGYAPYWTYKVGDTEKIVPSQITPAHIRHVSGTKLPFHRIVPYDLSQRYPSQQDDWGPDSDVVELMMDQVIRETGTEYVRTMSLNYHEIEGQKIRLYDVIDIYCPEIGIDESRPVVKVTYNVLRERNEGIQIGALQPNLPDLVSSVGNPREIGTNRTSN